MGPYQKFRKTVAVGLRARRLRTSARAFVMTRLTPLLPKPVWPAPTAREWAKARRQLERILTENIVPFWCSRALDLECGGYRLNHDIRGEWLGTTNKSLVAQAGTLWFFSALARTPYGTAEHLEAARHGYAFLRDRLWDAEFGGFFWEVDPSGERVTKTDKHLYAQGSALYALSEYAAAASDVTALDLSRRLLRLFDERAHDATYGGYVESFRRDWTPTSPDVKTCLGSEPSQKRMDTHLHLLKGMIPYYLATNDPLARERILELLLVQGNAVVRKTAGACTDCYRHDWTPILHGPHDLVRYGVDMANISQLMRACNALGIPIGPLLDLFRALFHYALRWGYDHKNGGFYDAGRLGAPADVRTKFFWVQSEALIIALEMYRLTQDPTYFHCFSKTLEWVVHRQVDWEHGEWFEVVSERGRPGGAKASMWKTGYHSGRAALLGLELVASLENNGESLKARFAPAASPSPASY